MDWFTWLSKTGLEPSLVYEYGLAFSHNELEEEDISYFNHEFLQSMGISIAKHRLEILKLAGKQQTSIPYHPVSKILTAIKRTKMCLSKYLGAWIRCEDQSALALVPRRPSYGARWRNVMVKRSKRLANSNMNNRHSRPPLLLTNGSPLMLPSSRIDSLSSPFVHGSKRSDDQKMEGDNGECDGDKYWACAGEEIRWDSMFQDLKPT